VGLDLAGLAELGNGERLVRVYGKGSKERLVPLGTMAARAVEEWLAPEGRAKLARANGAGAGTPRQSF